MLPHLSFFLHIFLTYLLPYLSFPLRIDPLCCQAGWRLKLAFILHDEPITRSDRKRLLPATGYTSQHYLVLVPRQGKLGGLQQEGHSV